MQKIDETDTLIVFYKEKGEHTLLSSDYTKDDSLFLYRLDAVTSGILIKAKTKEVYDELKEAQKNNRVKKTYRAVSKKAFAENFTDTETSKYFYNQVMLNVDMHSNLSFALSTYFRPYGKGRKCTKPVKIAEREKYKNKDVTARIYTTNIIKIEQSDDGSVVFTTQIQNGFRHQIRSHLSFLGYPIVGDVLYGGCDGVCFDDSLKNGIALECRGVEIDGVFSFKL